MRAIDHDSARYGYFADEKSLTAPVRRAASAFRGTHGKSPAMAYKPIFFICHAPHVREVAKSIAGQARTGASPSTPGHPLRALRAFFGSLLTAAVAHRTSPRPPAGTAVYWG